MRISIGRIFSGRIGHFVPDSLEQLYRVQSSKQSEKIIFYFFGGISNLQWAKMVKRNLKVCGSWLKYLWHWDLRIFGDKSISKPSSDSASRDMQGVLARNDIQFSLTDIEVDEALKWMLSLGWVAGEKIVCLNVRDSAYLSDLSLSTGVPQDVKEHTYRDSNVESFEASVRMLLDLGYWVFRMGKLAHNRLNIKHSKFIDYAFEENRSDLLDVWLFSNCTFCISTSSGPDWISIAFKRPVLFVNALPIAQIPSFAKCMWAPKRLFRKDNMQELTFQEYLDVVDYTSTEYRKNEIEIIDLREIEILNITKEFLEFLDPLEEESSSALHLQKLFWDRMKNWSRFSEFHEFIHPECRINLLWFRGKIVEEEALLNSPDDPISL